ncbi:type II toxin-antitoxin system RelE/ParE family toxin [Rhizobium chutanense]|uniref:Type II toxin-antitoxin system RelE/ParE family toxin n=1 Tax=Rhizobium chutanense TaxID=2035448 RepID=A0A432NSM6_9HYPH|nr:type II toxin-antitoxin system RelE/ParE family toxin [Rhizobium chutanense]RUM02632.1 type II toxin-antitoxin system RelE/ParE family toxin [Rhizobium chutanense]
MKVVFSRAARADLLAIGRHILEQNPARALSFMEELHSACVGIADMPHAFVKLRLPRLTGVRRRLFGNYLIFYRIEDSTVRVLRILHGARDYARILRRITDIS